MIQGGRVCFFCVSGLSDCSCILLNIILLGRVGRVLTLVKLRPDREVLIKSRASHLKGGKMKEGGRRKRGEREISNLTTL